MPAIVATVRHTSSLEIEGDVQVEVAMHSATVERQKSRGGRNGGTRILAAADFGCENHAAVA